MSPNKRQNPYLNKPVLRQSDFISEIINLWVRLDSVASLVVFSVGLM